MGINKNILPAVRKRIVKELQRNTYLSTITMILQKEFNLPSKDTIPLIKAIQDKMGRRKNG